jgi:hypothetical protein
MAGKDAYGEWLKKDLNSLIDALDLDDLKRHFLKSRWLDQVLWMEGKANTNQRRYYILRLTSIIGGIIVPALVSLNLVSENSRSFVQAITIILSLIVAISVSLEEFFRFGDRWRHYRQTVESLKMEGWNFFQLAGNYQNYANHLDAYRDFAARVDELQKHEMNIFITDIAREKAKVGDKGANSQD